MSFVPQTELDGLSLEQFQKQWAVFISTHQVYKVQLEFFKAELEVYRTALESCQPEQTRFWQGKVEAAKRFVSFLQSRDLTDELKTLKARLGSV